MAKRITEVQDKLEEMRRVRLDVEEALQTRRLEPIDPQTVLTYVKENMGLMESAYCAIVFFW